MRGDEREEGTPLTILSVAYPFAPVSLGTSGGSEQILAILDRELTRAGHHSVVIAQEGSSVEGTLIPIPASRGAIDSGVRSRAHQNHRRAISLALSEFAVDVIHFHGLDFDNYLPECSVPILVTLHLPPELYPKGVPSSTSRYKNRPKYNCVSRTQYEWFNRLPNMLEPVHNGVALDLFTTKEQCSSGYLLTLSRICPEKGIHFAIDAARLSGLPLVIAGEVYPYPEHQRYFNEEIVPRLDSRITFFGPADRDAKRHLLRGARCVLVPSTVRETSSLVAMEAAVCGIPVVAYNSGALAEIIEEGRSGYLVNDVDEMAHRISCCDQIDQATCISIGRRRFDSRRMMSDYETYYRRMKIKPSQ